MEEYNLDNYKNNSGTNGVRHAKGKLKSRSRQYSGIDIRQAEQNVKRDIYREMVSDVEEIINNQTLSYEGKFSIIHNVTWNWTQHDGKIEGNQLWSKAAYEKYIQAFPEGKHTAADLPKGKSFSKYIQITEDHIVPRNIVIDHIISNPYKKPIRHFMPMEEVHSNIEHFLDSYFLSCVITNEENDLLNSFRLKQSMPNNFYEREMSLYYRNPWARYMKQIINGKQFDGIEVYRVTWREYGRPKYWEVSADVQIVDLGSYAHSYR
jgi:hypothetical protein